MATAITVLWLRTPLHGTFARLIVAHASIYIAFGTRPMNAARPKIHRELEDAPAVNGASWTTTHRRIVLPIPWPQFLNDWLWIVAQSARDLPVPLMSTGNVVVSSLLWLMWEHSDLPDASALAILLVAALMSVVVKHGSRCSKPPCQAFRNRRNVSCRSFAASASPGSTVFTGSHGIRSS